VFPLLLVWTPVERQEGHPFSFLTSLDNMAVPRWPTASSYELDRNDSFDEVDFPGKPLADKLRRR
jgi:hypothetical protein